MEAVPNGGNTVTPAHSPGRIRIGVSGWSYRDWTGPYYPSGTAPEDQLAIIASTFPTVELNRTFYSLVDQERFRTWRDVSPERFVFSVKGSRFITHQKKLNQAATPLANFFASGVLELGEKLGPLLWQLPGSWRLNMTRLETFLGLLPRTFEEAAELAEGHDQRVQPASIPRLRGRLRHTLEIRHPSAFVPEVAELARDHSVAIAFSHTAHWPYTEEVTSDFIYLRLHGPGALYASSYRQSDLDQWAIRLLRWAEGGEPQDGPRLTSSRAPSSVRRDVYVYFDNDVGARAPRQAQLLIELVDRAIGPRR